MDQKDLKAKYMDIICKEVWETPSMQKYASDEYGYGIELADGDIAVLQKPRIKKDFCFGYGYCGVSTEEDQDRASGMVHHAETNENYFITKNLEEINKQLERLYDPRMVAYKGIPYHGQPKESKLKGIYFLWDVDSEEAEEHEWVKLTEEEVDAVINGYKELTKMFRKRLNTYLKRYGLTKVNAWSYLRD